MLRMLLVPCMLCLVSLSLEHSTQRVAEHVHGIGHVHMDVSCSPSRSADFDRALALLHNFWYARALEAFHKVIRAEPACAMAYWGAALTYNHPFWDAPSRADLSAAWALVQRGLQAAPKTPRERMYLEAVAALYRDAGAGSKSDRDEAFKDAMRAVYEQYPDDETKLFYGLSILGTIREGTPGFARQAVAARLFEEVYAAKPEHPGALHYLIHVYDDPEHAVEGLKAARAYASTAAAVPHAQHMPSHMFTRLGLWEESAATNENAWRTSEADVQRAGEAGEHRDFHSLNYLQYAYLQLGRYRDARRVTDLIGAQYEALPDRKTAADTPELQARHVRGRTIYALPDRVAYRALRYAEPLPRGGGQLAGRGDGAPGCAFTRFHRDEAAARRHGRGETWRRRECAGRSRSDRGALDGGGATRVRAANHHDAGEGNPSPGSESGWRHRPCDRDDE